MGKLEENVWEEEKRQEGEEMAEGNAKGTIV